jgi:TIR domain.
MAHDVFISYSSHDKPVADGICANLEGAGLRCWIAPRDIGPGEDWPTAIAGGISVAKVMVLVFSQNSNMSDEVSRELYLAANNKLAIIPFVIENVIPEAGKAYYMGRTHWMDAMNPPTQEQIGKLTKRVKSLVERVGTEGRVASVLAPVVPPYFRKSLNRKYGWIIPVVELVVAAALVVGSVFTVGRVTGAFNQPRATQVPTPSLPAATPTPVSPTLYLYREDFGDAQFDGGLPPDIRPNPGTCDNMTLAQQKGSLRFDAPANIMPNCGVSLGPEFFLNQIKSVEFALLSSPETSMDHPSFAVSLNPHVTTQTNLMVTCGLAAVTGGSGCVVMKGGGILYHTKPFIERTGTIYTFRMEVVDPDKMALRFLVNGEAIGEFTMTPADALAYKDLTYFMFGGLNSLGNTTRPGTYFLDYLAVEQP